MASIIPNYVEQLVNLPVETQFQLAKKLATNCGYQLVIKDNDRSLQIKAIIARITLCQAIVHKEGDRGLIKEALEKLL